MWWKHAVWWLAATRIMTTMRRLNTSLCMTDNFFTGSHQLKYYMQAKPKRFVWNILWQNSCTQLEHPFCAMIDVVVVGTTGEELSLDTLCTRIFGFTAGFFIPCSVTMRIRCQQHRPRKMECCFCVYTIANLLPLPPLMIGYNVEVLFQNGVELRERSLARRTCIRWSVV